MIFLCTKYKWCRNVQDTVALVPMCLGFLQWTLWDQGRNILGPECPYTLSMWLRHFDTRSIVFDTRFSILYNQIADLNLTLSHWQRSHPNNARSDWLWAGGTTDLILEILGHLHWDHLDLDLESNRQTPGRDITPMEMKGGLWKTMLECIDGRSFGSFCW